MKTMLKNAKIPVVIFTITALVSMAFCTPALAQDAQEELGKPSTFNVMIDAALYRPVTLLFIPVGFGLFVVSLPFSAIGGNVSDSFDGLVERPINYTFNRPLGDI